MRKRSAKSATGNCRRKPTSKPVGKPPRKSKVTRYTLTMTEEQTCNVMHALEGYARACIGQFDQLLQDCQQRYTEDGALRQAAERFVKRTIFPELQDNESYGIAAERLPLSARVAYDAYQYLRREVSWHRQGKDWRKDVRDWKTQNGRSYDSPFCVSHTGTMDTSVRED